MKTKKSKTRALAFIEEARDYDTAGDVLLVAMLPEVLDALEKAIVAFPDLATGGFDRTKAPFDAGNVQALVGISTALVFMKQLKPSKTTFTGSYGLKHVCEDWSDENGLSAYIANGALIVAAVALDFPVKRRGLNADIAVSRPEFKKFLKSFKNAWN